jgi:type IV pilus assembly protein PilO
MDVGEAIQKLNNLDVQDLRKIGTAPKPIQIAVILVLVIAIIGAIGWFVVRPQFETLEKEERTEQELRETFEEKQSRAANLEAYKKQLAQMEESFGAMLRQLPDETDMESLLVDLSQTSVAAGLDVKYFEPGNERQQEFYAEYPIELRVAGTYHEFGNFVSGLASLPRIVTLHDIAIKPSGNGNATGQNVDLSMQLEAKTYRYLEDGGGGSGN